MAADLQTVIDAHSGEPRAVPAAPAAAEGSRPSRPSAAAAPRAGRARAVRAPPGAPGLPARPLRRRGLRAASSPTSSRRRFRLTPQELQESLDLLNLVNFGGGCYAVYCATENGHIHVDKELYGDTFRRPARLSPLEAKALLRALDVVAPLVAAEAHTSLATVREKVEAAFGTYALADTPDAAGRPTPRSTPSRS